MVNQLNFPSQKMKIVIYSEKSNLPICFKEKLVTNYNGLESTSSKCSILLSSRIEIWLERLLVSFEVIGE